jgi:hypothetical protein
MKKKTTQHSDIDYIVKEFLFHVAFLPAHVKPARDNLVFPTTQHNIKEYPPAASFVSSTWTTTTKI